MIPGCGCDVEGRRLSRENGVKEVDFEVFPERYNRGTICYIEGGRVPKGYKGELVLLGKLVDLG